MSDEMTAPDGFEEYGNGGDSIELEPGDSFVGLVLSIDEGESEYGKWHKLQIRTEELGTVIYFAKGQAKVAVEEGDVEPGDEVWVGVDPEESTFTTPAGEERTFHEHRFAVAGEGE